MKLIDKDAVVAEIEKLVDKGKYHDEYDYAYRDGNNGALYALKNKLDTLEVKEVDLEKELIEWHKEHFKKDGTFIGMSGFYLTNSSQMDIAKHFFELGLNAQCKISYVPNIDDSLKEFGVDPTSKEAKIFKESYYMALEKLKTQKGE